MAAALDRERLAILSLDEGFARARAAHLGRSAAAAAATRLTECAATASVLNADCAASTAGLDVATSAGLDGIAAVSAPMTTAGLRARRH